MKHLARMDTKANAAVAALPDIPWPSADATRAINLLTRCPAASPTPLETSKALARMAGVGDVFVKDERARMGLGSFKALGAAYVIACDAENGQAAGRTYVTASAGNHGLSVAAGAHAFGAKSVVFIADTVPETFADRLRAQGATVVRHGAVYEDSMAEAARIADANGWALLSDSSWAGYVGVPHRLMEGYTVLMHEAAAEMPAPTHIFLQAGVGGLAAACAAYARHVWQDTPRIVVVEPEAAPALFASVAAGAPLISEGPSSDMGRLDCKEPSLIALKGLARDANDFVLISEDEGAHGAEMAKQAGFATTTSGAAGLSGLLACAAGQADLGLDQTSRVLVILSEGATQ